ncbi:MAG TPA: hypothetical protein VGD72_10675 [Mycobacteriales bacterium]
MTTSDPSVTPAKARRGRPAQADPAAPVPPVETADVALSADASADVPLVPPAPEPAGPGTAGPGPVGPGPVGPGPGAAGPGAVGPGPLGPEPVAPAPGATAGARRTRTVHLPYVTAIVEIPRMGRPRLPHVGRREVAEAAGAATSFLPPPRRLLFYGGLGALAALEVIDWPVAAVVAAGTYIARGGGQPDHEHLADRRVTGERTESALA